MAISEIPSLHLKPVAYKANKLYIKLPEGSIGNMTFARTSIVTRGNNEGLIEEMATGIPRLDYPLINGSVQSCPDSLLEPTSINLALRSEEIDNVVWTPNSGATVTANTSVSPDGTKTADRIKTSSTLTASGIFDFPFSNSAGTEQYTTSIFVKHISGQTEFKLGMSGGAFSSGSQRAIFNIKLRTFISKDAGIETATIIKYPNGWSRVNITRTTDQIGTFGIEIYNSVVGAMSFLVWGVQTEELPYSTSYIKTEGTTVTRATEECNSAGDITTFNSAEGVLYCEISALFDDLTDRNISLSNDDTLNRIHLRYRNSSNQIRVTMVVNNINQTQFDVILSDLTEFNKIAFSWKLNEFKFYVNGVQIGVTDTSGDTYPVNTLTSLSFNQGNNNNNFFGRTREIKVFKTSLTDAELTFLTTI